jgi:hypothetical protein
MDLYIHPPIHLHGVVLNYLSTGTKNLPFYSLDLKIKSSHTRIKFKNELKIITMYEEM